MQPSDGAVALRTLPRRYRDAARAASTTSLDSEPDDPAVDEMASRVGPDGISASDLVAAAAARSDDLDRWLRSALVSDAAIAPAALQAPDLDVSHHEGAPAFSAAVEGLAGRLEALAELVDGADPSRWVAELPTESGGTTTPLEVLQHGVAALVSGERRLSPLLRSVRGRRST